MRRGLLTFSAVLSIVSAVGAARLSDQEISEFGGCYFAPITSGGLWRMRTQDGEIREFEADARKPGRLVGVGGWWAAMQKDGRISVHAPETGAYPPIVYNFARGRLSSIDVEGRHCRFGYPNPLVYEDEAIVPLWPDSKKVSRDEFAQQTTMWKGGRRQTLWFASPNQAGAFLSFVVLVFLGLAALPRLGKVLRIAFIVLTVAAFAGLVWTASRGALVGVCLGAAAMAACSARLRGWLNVRRILIGLVAVAVVAAGVYFAMYHSSARDRRSDAKSDATRIELWLAAPAMMCDAPFGWGGFNGVGKAYSDWYASAADTHFRLNLVSDHLTMLVGHGWLGRFFYIFAWVAGLALLAVFAWRGGSSIPLGIWVSLGVASSLNVVLFAPTMLWLPCFALAPMLAVRRWFRPRLLVPVIVVGAAASLFALGSLWIAGTCLARQAPSVQKDGDRILVNGDAPDIWVVDDEEALGGVLAPRDIRAFYRKFPSAPAIGYVKSLSDVPAKGVKRLVLVGDSAQDFMVPYSRNAAAVAVPPEMVFLAPQFPPSAIPEELRAKSRVIMVIGEFAARYWGEYAHAPDWVGVIPGAEVYIPNWMAQCVETGEGGVPR